MDYFEPKTIVIAVCTMVFLAIVLDVMRRRKRNRYDNIQMSSREIDRSVGYEDDRDPFSDSQFPSGRSRVVSRDGEHDFSARMENEKQNSLFDQPEQGTLALDNEPVVKKTSPASKVSPKKQSSEKPKEAPQQEILVIHLMTTSGQTCSGQLLLDAVLERGLRYGEMKIFHRHTDENGSGPVLFSMANLLNPGTFDLTTIGHQELVGVTLFMAPLDLEKPADVFDLMIETAEYIAEKLQLNIMDESRSSMTKQTIEHYRQRAHQAILFQERSG
jgi:cell division protein ZipA